MGLNWRISWNLELSANRPRGQSPLVFSKTCPGIVRQVQGTAIPFDSPNHDMPDKHYGVCMFGATVSKIGEKLPNHIK